MSWYFPGIFSKNFLHLSGTGRLGDLKKHGKLGVLQWFWKEGRGDGRMGVFGFWPKIFETFIKAWRYTRFHVIGTWSSWYKNLFSTMPYLHLKFICHMVAAMALSCFRMVTHSYAASFSLKIILNEANNFSFSQEYQLLEKVNDRFWKYIKNKR